MRIFVTGASGFIGSAVVPELLAAGHDVVGLARSDQSAAAIGALGARPYRGSIEEPESLRAAAADSDGVIHLAYVHDFSRMAQAAEVDRRTIELLGSVLAGSDRPLVIAAGTLGLATGRVGTEQDRPDPSTHPRIANATATLRLAERGVRSVVVRVPIVHGADDPGFIATLVAIARAKSASGYIGDGRNRWPSVHRLDAAAVFRLAVETAPAGSVLHAVAEQGVPTRSIAEAIGQGLGLPVVSVPAEQAGAHFDWLAGFYGADSPVSSALTRKLLGWEPTRPELLDDLAAGYYFAVPAQ